MAAPGLGSGGALKVVAERVAAARSIAVLVGAGVSVGAGIPDFRSPGGMYDTLRPDLLTATEAERNVMRAEPTAVVDWSLFRHNQFPYLEVRRPFILGINEGRWKPTLSHYFIKELENRGKLARLYTQNIDGLDYNVGLGAGRVVACHGSLGKASCEFCSTEVDMVWFLQQLRDNIKDIYEIDSSAPTHSTNILCPSCSRPGVKPSTVLYGRQLPEEFFEAMSADFPENVDLVIVIGTSLTVGPANRFPLVADEQAPRIVINMEPVGQELGIRYSPEALEADGPMCSSQGRDMFLRGECDKSVAELIKELGWAGSLRAYQDQMSTSLEAIGL